MLSSGMLVFQERTSRSIMLNLFSAVRTSGLVLALKKFAWTPVERPLSKIERSLTVHMQPFAIECTSFSVGNARFGSCSTEQWVLAKRHLDL